MSGITLAQARTIIEAARKHGRALGLAPLTVAVLDSGGHPVALEREDRSGILRPEIAFGKAWGALGLGFGSRELFTRSQTAPSFVNAIAMASQGRLVPVPGGVLAESASGEILGAVGISGDLSENDEACAVAGIEAAGLKPRTGA
ncbi:MAG TPA: heme-binding protein [Acetobacteraceae bacterium]|jgi:uncharacterized protein GlcG (DUF336 family)|nr:heme-binding protein [Acetobacteraceae bacterium]